MKTFDLLNDENLIRFDELFKFEVMGGGFIKVDNDAKQFHIHGKSNSFGVADHRVTSYLLEKHFKNDPEKKDY